ncbi:MAG: fused MFS/spermidine synthase [Bacteroidetes bacterium]|nr:fused MFS/spermidine synthase [Bacteroidota bacterium]MBX7129486.1 fused MFS/spermidine synthase [Flavobacteriales bacterium]MCC6654568.1 fused MFS/spermidine synthase [Flavobacteriales bacterium]HMU14619.1 fused MFS/spermidine synthase [Flavobacteriales bacterium]HMW96643.1 fused MFS/spermidine synthase [Flavobacteriales bacterium]
MMLARLLSWFWPVRMRTEEGTLGTVELTWEQGRLVVNSANANQSFGSLHRVWQEAFAKAGVATERPLTTLLLGYGGGSAVHILQKELGLETAITGVDMDPLMLRIAREFFPPPHPERVRMVQADAFTYVREAKETFDLVVVDLFRDLDFTEGVESPEFLRDLKHILTPGGTLLLNTIAHDERSTARSARSGRELRLLFNHVEEHPCQEHNRVFIAW